MIESITWYLKNTTETLPKFQENYIYNYEYISYILSLQFETISIFVLLLLISSTSPSFD
jgi:hypothetical protein